MSQSLLIAGATGFIGGRTAAIASDRGWKVTGLSRNAPNDVSGMEGVTWLQADLSDAGSLESALADRQFTHVINLGGDIHHQPMDQGGQAMMNVHFSGTANLLSACRHNGLRGFLQVGSSDEYGGHPAPQTELLREQPISPYALAKVAATQLMQMLHRTEGLPTKVARLFLVYGPGQNSQRFIPQLIRGCISGRPFPVSEGHQLRDFCYVDNVADGLLDMVASERANGECLNLGCGTGVSIRSMIERVVAIVGGGNPSFGEVAYRPGENMALVPDVSRAAALINWSPATGLDQGLEQTVRWYVDRIASA